MTAYTHMCAFGMTSRDREGEGPVKKPTVFLTNSVEIRKQLDRRCPGCPRHVQLMEGRAKNAQIYPKALCRAIANGIISQAQMDAQNLFSMECNGFEEINNMQHDSDDWKKYWDDNSGEELDSRLTQEARMV